MTCGGETLAAAHGLPWRDGDTLLQRTSRHVRFDHSLRALTAAKSGSVRSADQASCRAARRAGGSASLGEKADDNGSHEFGGLDDITDADLIGSTSRGLPQARDRGGMAPDLQTRSQLKQCMERINRRARLLAQMAVQEPVADEAKDACVHPSRPRPRCRSNSQIHISDFHFPRTNSLAISSRSVHLRQGSSKNTTTPTSSRNSEARFRSRTCLSKKVTQRRLPRVPV